MISDDQIKSVQDMITFLIDDFYRLHTPNLVRVTIRKALEAAEKINAEHRP